MPLVDMRKYYTALFEISSWLYFRHGLGINDLSAHHFALIYLDKYNVKNPWTDYARGH
jgi:hypothetical protein